MLSIFQRDSDLDYAFALPVEMKKFGNSLRGALYIQLASFPSHYLVLVLTEEEFRFALISVTVLTETPHANLIMGDIGWLDVNRIHGGDIIITHQSDQAGLALKPANLTGAKRYSSYSPGRFWYLLTACCSFDLETQVLRELYAYCWYSFLITLFGNKC